jgi:hypothetical protein
MLAFPESSEFHLTFAYEADWALPAQGRLTFTRINQQFGPVEQLV